MQYLDLNKLKRVRGNAALLMSSSDMDFLYSILRDVVDEQVPTPYEKDFLRKVMSVLSSTINDKNYIKL